MCRVFTVFATGRPVVDRSSKSVAHCDRRTTLRRRMVQGMEVNMQTIDTLSLPATSRRLLVRARVAAIVGFLLALWAASLFTHKTAEPPCDVVARGH
jgi:hypothetical protein